MDDHFEQARRAFALDPSITFLNHGSFGACPRPVLERQTALRAAMEARPVAFLDRDLPAMIEGARQDVATFLAADPGGLAFVSNATTAVAIVLASVDLRPGDEVVISDHAYPAVQIAVRAACERAGARVIMVRIPLPIEGPEHVVSCFTAAMGDAARLVLIDHISSATAAIFPVAQIVSACKARGILAFVDAAHAPGMVPIDLRALGADWWTGNLHKWVCAPKGAAVLWVAPEHRERTRPLVPSHRFNEGFLPSFDWNGTADPTAMLSAPTALAFFEALGWDRVRSHNRALATDGRATIAEVIGAPCVIPASMTGSMALIPFRAGIAATKDAARALQARILADAAVEVPISAWEGRGLMRISAQIYNEPGDYERLANALPATL